MRYVGTIATEQLARRFGDYLVTCEVKNRVDEEDGGWGVWVYDEDQLAEAKEQLTEFLDDPTDPLYDVRDRAQTIRRASAKAEREAAKRYVRVRDRWGRAQRGPVTTGLIAASIVVALVTGFGRNKRPVVTTLSIADYEPTDSGGVVRLDRHFADVREGQIWRLVTPMFIHFGPLHLVLNMFALYYLGNLIEGRKGSLRMAAMVLILAVVSNVAQYQFSAQQSPVFGGMSGVIFGLFGYLWMKTVFDPAGGLQLPSTTIVFVMGWFVLCVFGWFGPIANWAHGGGLVVGMVFGVAAPVWRALMRHS